MVLNIGSIGRSKVNKFMVSWKSSNTWENGRRVKFHKGLNYFCGSKSKYIDILRYKIYPQMNYSLWHLPG